MDVVYGRALTALDVYDSLLPRAVVTKRLWPDTVVRILDSVQDWYLFPDGYAKRSGIQPMALHSETAFTSSPPFWAEVGGAVAVLRRWCAADAPLVARIGHGGVAQVVDMLSGDQDDWYAVADENAFLGWSPATPWIPLDESTSDINAGQVYIDTSVGQLQYVQNDRLVLHAPVSFGTSLSPGIYPVQQRKRSVIFQMENTSDGYGVPWMVDFGGHSLAGAYWHNEFGSQKFTPGSSVQVPTAVARWLYERLPEGSSIVVR